MSELVIVTIAISTDNKENNVFKDGIGVGLKFHGNNHGNHGKHYSNHHDNHGNHHSNQGNHCNHHCM